MPDEARSNEDPEGRFANYFQIGFNAHEFVFDFGQQYSPDPMRIHTRIVTSPSSARTFMELFADSLRQYGYAYERPETTDV